MDTRTRTRTRNLKKKRVYSSIKTSIFWKKMLKLRENFYFSKKIMSKLPFSAKNCNKKIVFIIFSNYFFNNKAFMSMNLSFSFKKTNLSNNFTPVLRLLLEKM